ncbi:MAG TPA: MFS transporter [Thermotogota bacterium]|nr:MFS transporter [Thermotogota bacterium]HRW92537.1 MFS transporter [Thermotogota bacterium]
MLAQPTQQEKWTKNISRNYFFVFLGSVQLTQGFWMIFLAARGMSLAQIGILEGLFHVTSLAMEVPTGAIADLLGRKISRTLARLCAIISPVLMLTGTGFWWYALSLFFSALSYNLESGAGEALVYDSLKALKRETHYIKVIGYQEALYQLGTVVSLLLGGWIAQQSYVLGYSLTIVLCAVVFLYSFTFSEPPVFVEKRESPSFRGFFRHTLQSFQTLCKNKAVAFLTIYTQVLLAFCTTLFFYLQNYWKGIGIGEFQIGFYLALGSIAGAALATQIQRIRKLLGEKLTFALFSLMALGGTWCIALFEKKWVFFLGMALVDSGLFVAFNDFLNRAIPSHQRATILSMGNMLFSLVMVGIFPLFGWIAQLFRFEGAFLFLALVFTGLVLAALGALYKLRKRV